MQNVSAQCDQLAINLESKVFTIIDNQVKDIAMDFTDLDRKFTEL